MFLNELTPGAQAVMLSAPDVALPHCLRPGQKLQLVMTRPELSVVELEGKAFVVAGSWHGRS